MKDWTQIGRSGRTAWQATAAHFELRYHKGTANKAPFIVGNVEGFDVHITCTDDRKPKPPAVTVYQIDYASLGGPIRIGRESTLGRVKILRKLTDIVDLEIGDQSFDKLALIDAADVESAVTFLTYRRRQAITELLCTKGLRNVMVTESTTSFDTRGVEDSPRQLAGNLLGLIEFAKIIGPSIAPDGALAPSNNLAPVEELRSYFDLTASGGPDIQDEVR